MLCLQRFISRRQHRLRITCNRLLDCSDACDAIGARRLAGLQARKALCGQIDVARPHGLDEPQDHLPQRAGIVLHVDAHESQLGPITAGEVVRGIHSIRSSTS